MHSSLKETPNFLWSGSRLSIKYFRVWGFQVYVKNHKESYSYPRVRKGYFMGYKNSRVIIR